VWFSCADVTIGRLRVEWETRRCMPSAFQCCYDDAKAAISSSTPDCIGALSNLVLMAPHEARCAEQIQRVTERQAIELLTKTREVAMEVTEDDQHDSLLSDIAHDLPIVH
jgi:hypothetical protein